MKIIRFLKYLYHDIFKDLYKLTLIFIFLDKKINLKKINKKILINNQYHEDFSWLNYLLGYILKKKGYEVKFLICSGNSYCERMLHNLRRPNCKTCNLGNRLRLKAFNHDYIDNNSLKQKDPKNKVYNFNYDNILKENQEENIINGVKINDMFNVSFLHFFKGSLKSIKDKIDICKNMFSTVCKNIFTAEKLISEFKPDKIITISGKNIQTGPLYNFGRLKKIDCYTYDIINHGFKCILTKNDIALNQYVSKDIWDSIIKKKLSSDQRNKARNFIDLHIKGLNTQMKYQDEKSITSHEEINQILKLDRNKKIISIFPNKDFDSSVIGVEATYKNLYHFLEGMVKLSRELKDYNFVVRTHPEGSKTNMFTKSTRPLNIFIYENLKDIMGENFYVIKPDSKIDSFELAKISEHRIIFTSTMGLELPFMNMKTIVCGNAYFRNKGFSIDPINHEDLLKILKNNIYEKKLNQEEIEILEKVIYLTKFQRLFSPPFFEKFRFVLPKKIKSSFETNLTINNMAEFIQDKRNFLHLDKN